MVHIFCSNAEYSLSLVLYLYISLNYIQYKLQNALIRISLLFKFYFYLFSFYNGFVCWMGMNILTGICGSQWTMWETHYQFSSIWVLKDWISHPAWWQSLLSASCIAAPRATLLVISEVMLTKPHQHDCLNIFWTRATMTDMQT